MRPRDERGRLRYEPGDDERAQLRGERAWQREEQARRSRWRRTVAMLVVAALPAAVSVGCGVPSESDVVVQGQGRAPDRSTTGDDTSTPPTRTATTNEKEFVENFLAAAAGNPDEAATRVKEFYAPDLRTDWNLPEAVNVVRLTRPPVITQAAAGAFDVRVSVLRIGQLLRNGTVDTRAGRRAPQDYQFRIAPIQRQGSGLYVQQKLPDILLSDDALERYYEQRTLYFWAKDHTTLVPDLRYLPRQVPVSQRPTQIVQWLLDGPSPWLEPTVESLPDQALKIGNVPAGEPLVVNLSKAADPGNADEVRRLAIQLRWSLRALRPTAEQALDLRLDQTRQFFSGAGYLSANPAYHAGHLPVRFCVYQKQVRLLVPLPRDAPAVPDLPPQFNTAVERAALHSEDGTVFAAVVRSVGGQQELYVGVGSGAGATMKRLDSTSLKARSIGQPVWLPGDRVVGLVAVGGVVKKFGAKASEAPETVAMPHSDVTALAVPPDGRRLAYIAKGRLYVAALTRTGAAVTVGQPQEVPTPLTHLDAVAWSQQSWLVVAGRQPGGLPELEDVTLDGALHELRTKDELGNADVTHLVAYADDTADGPGPGQIMYVANGVAYNMFSTPEPIAATDVAGVEQPPSPSNGPRDPIPTAPFFLD